MTCTHINSGQSRPAIYVASAAAILAAGMSAFGVASAFWDGLARSDLVTWVASGVIIGVLTVSEVGALILAAWIGRHAEAGARAWAVVAALVYGACTIGNVLAGHYGAEAISTRLVAPQRAPFAAAVAAALADIGAARDEAAAFERRVPAEAADLEAQLTREAALNPAYVTSRGKLAEAARAALSLRQTSERGDLADKLAKANKAVARADAALATAPSGFTPAQMWGFAGLLELLKGVLVLIATPRRRRIAGLTMIAPQNAAEMTIEEMLEEQRRARSWATTLQHELGRRAGVPPRPGSRRKRLSGVKSDGATSGALGLAAAA